MKDTQRITDFNKLEYWIEDGHVIIRKRSAFLGVLKLTNIQTKTLIKGLAKLVKRMDGKKKGPLSESSH